jgi:CBS-domain-containing membrane protein
MNYEPVANHLTQAESVRRIDFSSFDAFDVDAKDADSLPYSGLQIAARAMQLVGYALAFISLFLVIAGAALWTIVLGTFGAFVGSLGSALAQKVGPRRWLKGVRVKDVLTPVCREVLYHTRIQDLMQKYPFGEEDCCGVVKRDGHVLGILLPEDVLAVDLGRHAESIAEHKMKPVDLVESVNVNDDAADVVEIMRHRRRDYVPVIERNRLVGIVRKGRIAEAARRASAIRKSSDG